MKMHDLQDHHVLILLLQELLSGLLIRLQLCAQRRGRWERTEEKGMPRLSVFNLSVVFRRLSCREAMADDMDGSATDVVQGVDEDEDEDVRSCGGHCETMTLRRNVSCAMLTAPMSHCY